MSAFHDACVKLSEANLSWKSASEETNVINILNDFLHTPFGDGDAKSSATALVSSESLHSLVHTQDLSEATNILFQKFAQLLNDASDNTPMLTVALTVLTTIAGSKHVQALYAAKPSVNVSHDSDDDIERDEEGFPLPQSSFSSISLTSSRLITISVCVLEVIEHHAATPIAMSGSGFVALILSMMSDHAALEALCSILANSNACATLLTCAAVNQLAAPFAWQALAVLSVIAKENAGVLLKDVPLDAALVAASDTMAENAYVHTTLHALCRYHAAQEDCDLRDMTGVVTALLQRVSRHATSNRAVCRYLTCLELACASTNVLPALISSHAGASVWGLAGREALSLTGLARCCSVLAQMGRLLLRAGTSMEDAAGLWGGVTFKLLLTRLAKLCTSALDAAMMKDKTGHCEVTIAESWLYCGLFDCVNQLLLLSPDSETLLSSLGDSITPLVLRALAACSVDDGLVIYTATHVLKELALGGHLTTEHMLTLIRSSIPTLLVMCLGQYPYPEALRFGTETDNIDDEAVLKALYACNVIDVMQGRLDEEYEHDEILYARSLVAPPLHRTKAEAKQHQPDGCSVRLDTALIQVLSVALDAIGDDGVLFTHKQLPLFTEIVTHGLSRRILRIIEVHEGHPTLYRLSMTLLTALLNSSTTRDIVHLADREYHDRNPSLFVRLNVMEEVITSIGVSPTKSSSHDQTGNVNNSAHNTSNSRRNSSFVTDTSGNGDQSSSGNSFINDVSESPTPRRHTRSNSRDYLAQHSGGVVASSGRSDKKKKGIDFVPSFKTPDLNKPDKTTSNTRTKRFFSIDTEESPHLAGNSFVPEDVNGISVDDSKDQMQISDHACAGLEGVIRERHAVLREDLAAAESNTLAVKTLQQEATELMQVTCDFAVSCVEALSSLFVVKAPSHGIMMNLLRPAMPLQVISNALMLSLAPPSACLFDPALAANTFYTLCGTLEEVARMVETVMTACPSCHIKEDFERMKMKLLLALDQFKLFVLGSDVVPLEVIPVLRRSLGYFELRVHLRGTKQGLNFLSHKYSLRLWFQGENVSIATSSFLDATTDYDVNPHVHDPDPEQSPENMAIKNHKILAKRLSLSLQHTQKGQMHHALISDALIEAIPEENSDDDSSDFHDDLPAEDVYSVRLAGEINEAKVIATPSTPKPPHLSRRHSKRKQRRSISQSLGILTDSPRVKDLKLEDSDALYNEEESEDIKKNDRTAEVAEWEQLLSEFEDLPHTPDSIRTLALTFRKDPRVVALLKQSQGYCDGDGLPPQVRGRLWRLVSGGLALQRAHPSGYYNELVRKAATDEFKATFEWAQICKDVPRTTLDGVTLLETKEGREALERVLSAYCLRCPETVGYCQSMNIVCGTLLTAINDEEAVFFVLCCMVEQRLGYYAASMCGIRVDQLVLRDLVWFNHPEINEHLISLGVSVNDFVVGWFLCLFMESPVSYVDCICLWDYLFLTGGDVLLFEVALGILRVKKQHILQMRSAEDFLMVFLRKERIQQDIDTRRLLGKGTSDAAMQLRAALTEQIHELREFHRATVLEENGTLEYAKVQKLVKEFGFTSETEMQALWSGFLRPAPWKTLLSSTQSNRVWFYKSFCHAAFDHWHRRQWRDHGLFSGVLKRIFTVLDTNDSNEISFQEYLQGVWCFRHAPAAERMALCFRFCDLDGDGRVSFSDLCQAFFMCHQMYTGYGTLGQETHKISAMFASLVFQRAKSSFFLHADEIQAATHAKTRTQSQSVKPTVLPPQHAVHQGKHTVMFKPLPTAESLRARGRQPGAIDCDYLCFEEFEACVCFNPLIQLLFALTPSGGDTGYQYLASQFKIMATKHGDGVKTF